MRVCCQKFGKPLRDLFLGHCEKQQAKLLALAGGLHWRFGVESVVFRMDDSLLKMIWDQAQKRSVVPPMVFDPPPPTQATWP